MDAVSVIILQQSQTYYINQTITKAKYITTVFYNKTRSDFGPDQFYPIKQMIPLSVIT